MADSTPITHSRVLKIALPVALANATVPILGLVDTGVVGQLGAAAPIGAVGVGAVIITVCYWLFGFLRMGTAGLAAQALGRGETAEDIAILMRALIAGAGIGVVLIIVQWPLFLLAFRISPASPEVEALAHSYLGIRIWSAPAAIALYGITGWLIAQERTRAVLVLQLWMNGLNILLDLVFVLGLGWGVEGVALATVIAEWSGLGLGFWILRAQFRGDLWRNWTQILDPARLRHMAAVNSDIMIRSALLLAGFSSLTFLGAGLGDVTLAANQVLLQFLYIFAHTLDGFAFAAESLVGQAMGARRRNRLRRAVWLCGLWIGACSILLSIVFMLAGPMIIDIMTTAPEVRAEARIYIGWLIVSPLLGALPFLLDGVFIGATRTRDMRNMMAVSTALYFAVAFLLLPIWGNHALWFAMSVYFVAHGLTL
ncbi:MATE family efflux transporter, partial [Rhodobacteraceae bacterium (ex Bugula neritina AB1)]